MQKIKSLLIANLLKLFHKLPDGIKLYLRSFKKQEQEFYELRWLVDKDTIAVDIGANKGAYTYALSKIVGKKGLVISIEPIEELASYIAFACQQLKLPVRVEQCCLSDKEGDGYLFIPIEDNTLQTGLATLNRKSSSQCEGRQVKIKCLEEILRGRNKRVSFIKCDVEGHELKVFQGALDILKSDRPNILVEIEQRHCDEPIVSRFNFFKENGYEGFFLTYENVIKELKRINPDWLLSSEILASKLPKGVINFIFIPTESIISDYPHFNKLKQN